MGIAYMVLVFIKNNGDVCCFDVWDGATLTDTAKEQGLFIKRALFFSQVCACLCVFLDLLAIWLFCPERQTEIQLIEPEDHEANAMITMDTFGFGDSRH